MLVRWNERVDCVSEGRCDLRRRSQYCMRILPVIVGVTRENLARHAQSSCDGKEIKSLHHGIVHDPFLQYNRKSSTCQCLPSLSLPKPNFRSPLLSRSTSQTMSWWVCGNS